MTTAEVRAEIKRLKVALKEYQRARRRQFQIDRWRRERRHLSLNRYAIQH
jgi:hypothetical protein